MKFKFYNYLFWPPKKPVFGFEKKPPNNCFFVFWPWFSFKNNGHTNVLQVGIFENALKSYVLAVKNVILAVCGDYWLFLVHIQKYWPKQHVWVYCFLRKYKRKIWRKVLKVFFSKLKNTFWGINQHFYIFFSFSLKTIVDLVNIWSVSI